MAFEKSHQIKNKLIKGYAFGKEMRHTATHALQAPGPNIPPQKPREVKSTLNMAMAHLKGLPK